MILALLGKAYTGKTTIALELERRHGYVVAYFNDYLKWLTAYALQVTSPHNHPHYEEMLANKAKYRRLYQEFGAAIGFDSDPTWIKEFIRDLPDEVTGNFWQRNQKPCVIDCLRSEVQVLGARAMGVKIVGVDATYISRANFAAKTAGDSAIVGVTGRRLVEDADDHPIDGSLDLSKMSLDLRVINGHRSTVADVADEIASFFAPVFASEQKEQQAKLEAVYGKDL